MFHTRFLLAGLLVFPVLTDAGDVTFGSWVSGSMADNSGFYAATVNDSGDVFGEYCSFESKSCFWVLAVDSGCEKNSVYPTLGNTDKGAASLELVCAGPGESKWRYTFQNWKELESLVKQGTRLGLAMPMKADEFRVHRFLLNGLIAATTMTENTFAAALNARNPDGQGRIKQNTATDTL